MRYVWFGRANLLLARGRLLVDDTETVENGADPRPAVTVSYAQTLDGRLATADDSSQWISSSESLRFAHTLQSR